MNSIFHYYLIQFLALKSNFSPAQAYTLAYSSAYVDHNMVPEKIQLSKTKGFYLTIPTHHLGFWDPSQEMTVWKPFHFFPGGSKDLCSTLLLPGFTQTTAHWITLANSDPVKELLVEALKTKNLYRIGIALHTFADSWAHQLFLGMEHQDNHLVKRSPIPSVGHAQAGRIPDKIQYQWTDPRRIDPRVNNWQVYKSAAQKIYRYLCTFQRKSFDDEDLVLQELEDLLIIPFHDQSGTRSIQHNGSLNKLVKKAREYVMNELTVPSEMNLAMKKDEQIALDFRIHFNLLPYNRHEWKKRALGKASYHHEEQLADNQRDMYFWLKHELTNKYRPDSLVPKLGTEDFELSDYYLWMEAAKAHLQVAELICNQI